MLSVLLFLRDLRFTVAVAALFFSAPNCHLLWLSWRVVSLPFSNAVYYKGDAIMYSLYQRLIMFFGQHLNGIETHYYGTDIGRVLKTPENALYMSNHQSAVDWFICDMMAIQQGRLGSIRYILKNGLRYIPLYGHYFRQHGMIFVSRSGKFNLEKYRKHLSFLDGIPGWLVVFPEGTRYSPEKTKLHQQSIEFARSKGRPEYKHLITPRHKALYHTFLALRHNFTCVFDVTIAYSSTYDRQTDRRLPSPEISQFINGACSSEGIHVHIEKLPLEDVPIDEDKFVEWLDERFVIKDRLLREFYEGRDRDLASGDGVHGNRLTFPGDKLTCRSRLRDTLPAVAFFATLGFISLRTKIGRQCYFLASTLGTISGILWLAVFDR